MLARCRMITIYFFMQLKTPMYAYVSNRPICDISLVFRHQYTAPSFSVMSMRPTRPPLSYLCQPVFRYALDEGMSAKLRKANPEAFQNILKRMLEANGRGFWDPDEEVLERIRQQYADVEDDIELGSGGRCGCRVCKSGS